MKSRFKNVFHTECGGCSIETIIAIGVALIMGIAMINFSKFTYDIINAAAEHDRLNPDTQIEQTYEEYTYEQIIDIYGLEKGLEIIEIIESK